EDCHVLALLIDSAVTSQSEFQSLVLQEVICTRTTSQHSNTSWGGQHPPTHRSQVHRDCAFFSLERHAARSPAWPYPLPS
ncbi:hypothetical protein EV363DRAFT_1135221, partial [Boletus edulis]